MTVGDTEPGAGARVVDLDAERRARRPEADAEAALTDAQRAVLRRVRSARRRLLTRSS